jgi:MFS transporter, NNP family, nitrate/nitrite transporter
MSFLYAVTFGGFVAFSTYLPTYLKTIYDFSQTEAGTRTAGFAVAAVIARPIGGILSDRIHPKPVVLISLAGAAVMAIVTATQPEPEMPAGLSFVALAFFLGIGTGGVFAWVAARAPAERVGSVTGIVGAAGGLGGYFPPLIMGATYDEADNDYTVGLSLLCVTAVVALLFVWFGLREAGRTGRGATTFEK